MALNGLICAEVQLTYSLTQLVSNYDNSSSIRVRFDGRSTTRHTSQGQSDVTLQ